MTLSDSSQFFEIARYSGSDAAHIAKAKLESEGLVCILSGQIANWAYPGVVGDIGLSVPREDVIRARHILERVEAGRETRADVEES